MNPAAKTIHLTTLEDCPSGLFVKYLDSKTGGYKHWLFNRYYLTEEETISIGKVIAVATSLADALYTNLGKRVQPRVSATAENITQEMLDYLAPISTSPRVYIQVGTEWVEVNVTDMTIPTRWRKGNSGSIIVSFELDKKNTITML